ncbi:hypothetical protein DIPPA_29146 [Diplonema papillatum]|nr:hypothetical protein DIPPA_29146 [Diplonema papillatum]
MVVSGRRHFASLDGRNVLAPASAHVPVAPKVEGKREDPKQKGGERLSTPSGRGQPRPEPFGPPT